MIFYEPSRTSSKPLKMRHLRKENKKVITVVPIAEGRKNQVKQKNIKSVSVNCQVEAPKMPLVLYSERITVLLNQAITKNAYLSLFDRK